MDVSKQHISSFIRKITEKNYSEANKYLQAAINEKMKTRIRKAAR